MHGSDSNAGTEASVSGSDSASGTEAEPFATAQRLVGSLEPGDTGCLRAGVYDQNVKVTRGGTSAARVTLRSFPGERATLRGRLWIPDSSNFVTVEGLNLDGSTAPACGSGSTCDILPSPTVNGDDARFTLNDVTNQNTGICFLLGNKGYGEARRPTLEGNRIHDCGRRPSGNRDHGVYVEDTVDAKIERNAIFDNVDRGVHLYPDAQRTTVRDNVIDGNGEGILFAGEDGTATSDSTVEENTITNSRLRYNVESFWAAGNPVGTGNVATRNCIRGGARDNGNGGIKEVQEGFTAFDNVIRDPLYRDRSRGDYRMGSDSPCSSLVEQGPWLLPFTESATQVDSPPIVEVPAPSIPSQAPTTTEPGPDETTPAPDQSAPSEEAAPPAPEVTAPVASPPVRSNRPPRLKAKSRKTVAAARRSRARAAKARRRATALRRGATRQVGSRRVGALRRSG